MELKQQVVSLELAKKLKELGVKQDSLFFYDGLNGDFELCCLVNNSDNITESDVSAFTVADLGDMLPTSVTPSDVLGQKQKIFYIGFDFWE